MNSQSTSRVPTPFRYLNSRRQVNYPARLLGRTVEAIRRYWTGGNAEWKAQL